MGFGRSMRSKAAWWRAQTGEYFLRHPRQWRLLTLFPLALVLFVLLARWQLFPFFALVHRYPEYRGQVLEFESNQPIEGAGVLAVYVTGYPHPAGGSTRYLGYRGVLTNAEGRFRVRPKWFWTFRPLNYFERDVTVTIFKYGYGNLPGSFRRRRTVSGYVPELPKYGKMEPDTHPRTHVPPDTDVTIWLPKLEGREEIIQHMNRIAVSTTIFDDRSFPHDGMTREQFGVGVVYKEEKLQ